MEEIKVGEYVRLARNQGINKIEEIEDDVYILEYDIADEWGDLTCEIAKYKLKDEVLKHSFNIIDLIEEGDYVNGEIINGISEEDGKRLVYHGAYSFMDEVHFRNEDIKSIVTHEQFKSVEYEV